VLTYYITDRSHFAAPDAERRRQLLHAIGRASAAGVDYIQLREKDLTARDFEQLACEALHAIRVEGPSRLLINHRTDIALAAGADGVHLTGDDISAADARAIAAKHCVGRKNSVDTAGSESQRFPARFVVAVSCHSAEQVRLAYAHGADFAVLAPIFEKVTAEGVREGIGLEELRRATRQPAASDATIEAGEIRAAFPVLALGGVDRERAPLCAAAGAAGVAGIRLFQQAEDLRGLVSWLKQL
jgi:thiamine-phosphate pyrophosphorylase